MRRKAKRRWWHFRWVTLRLFKRLAVAAAFAGAAVVGDFLFHSRKEVLQHKKLLHDYAANQLRVKAKVAALLADADQPTDYVMAYHHSCFTLSQYDPAKLDDAELDARVKETVRTCAFFRPDSEPPRTDPQMDMACRSARLFFQAAKHSQAAAKYRQAIWIPWTVTQDIAVVSDDP